MPRRYGIVALGIMLMALGGAPPEGSPSLPPWGGGDVPVPHTENPWDSVGYWHNRYLDSLLGHGLALGGGEDEECGGGSFPPPFPKEGDWEAYILEVQDSLLEWMLNSALSYDQVYRRLLFWESMDLGIQLSLDGEVRKRRGESFSVLRYSLYYWWWVHQPPLPQKRRKPFRLLILVMADFQAMVCSGDPWVSARESARAYRELEYALPRPIPKKKEKRRIKDGKRTISGDRLGESD